MAQLSLVGLGLEQRVFSAEGAGRLGVLVKG